MATKKFYAVAKGRRPGIYTSWPLAETQVKGFPGARFKGFASRREAEAWLADPAGPSRRRAPKPPPARTPSSTDDHPEDAVIIYTDGGSINNPGPGGYGIVQLYQGERKEISGGYRLTTNNRMELTACIVALRQLPRRDRKVILHSDSSYVVNGISKGWARGWRKRGWIKSDRKPAINPDLWGELLDLVEGLDITFKWVRGHAGNPLNERCDELAVSAARQSGLPPDEGYEANGNSSMN